ncbi:MAG: hypothetical protein IKZ87_00420 [Actinomycetaceae bacterium]|nr:hypothetical protein [Actinomycetaceae bacterium]
MITFSKTELVRKDYGWSATTVGAIGRETAISFFTCRLVNGHLWTMARVDLHAELSFIQGGEFRRIVLNERTNRATAKRVQEQHNRALSADMVRSILEEARQYYATRPESLRYTILVDDLASELGAPGTVAC